MLTCREATQLLSEKRDRNLEFIEKSNLSLHLLICKPCRRYGKHIKIISQLCKEFKNY